MKVPSKIKAEIQCDLCTNLGGIILQLKVSAGRKNPYYILLDKTDSSGHSSITREDFIGQFKDHWEMGLMDYDGSIESANQVVEISLFDPTWLIENKKLAMAWPLLKHEKTKWKSREEQYNSMTSCRNKEFSFQPFPVDLHMKSEIIFKISKR